MLRRLALLVFPFVFVSALLILLTFTLEMYRLFDGFGTPRFEASVSARIWHNLVFAGYFLVMSGYLLIFLVSYFFLTRRWLKLHRMIVSVALFIGCYMVFSLMMGHDITLTWGALLVAGILSVAISDALAEVFHRQETGPGSLPDHK